MDTLHHTPTWGEKGVTYARLVATGETRSLECMKRDLANAMAMAEAYAAIRDALPPNLQLQSGRIYRDELDKQGY